MQGRLQEGTARLPARIENASLTQACGLDPVECRRSPLAVVAGKDEVPEQQHDRRRRDVNENPGPHGISLIENPTSADRTAQEAGRWKMSWAPPGGPTRYNGSVIFRIRPFQ